jgi:serine/threonine protein kinase
MLKGIAHCHGLGLIHRDIKPDNFLVGDSNGAIIKLADFGFSTKRAILGGVSGIFGTAPFMSPEMLVGDWYTEKTDVWSFGATMYALLFGAFPYMPANRHCKAMKQAIVEGGTPSFRPDARLLRFLVQYGKTGSIWYSDEALALVQALLNRLPEQRLSAQDALRTRWMGASQKGHHLPLANLPSLRPSLYACKKIGAFQTVDPWSSSRSDTLLHVTQVKRNGIPLPDSNMSVVPSKAGLQRDELSQATKSLSSSASTKDTSEKNCNSMQLTACDSSAPSLSR